MPVVAAGSLLEFVLADHSFSMPVGRIEYLHLGPMSFAEYLRAADPGLAEHLAALELAVPPPEAAHRRLLRRCREYLLVDGLPEAVLTHGESAGSPIEVAAVHRSIAETYEDDFAKYARNSQLVRLQRLFRSIPGSVGRKVVYRTLDHELRAAEVRDAIDLLVKARLCHRVLHSSGSLKSLLQFAHEKRPPLAVRFDTNPPSLQTVRHTIRTADGLQPVTLQLLSLPLYAVDASSTNSAPRRPHRSGDRPIGPSIRMTAGRSTPACHCGARPAHRSDRQ